MSATATRVTFGETVTRLADDNPDIVVLDADLRKSTMTDEFSRKHPERFFDVGIAEGNMVGVGAGMALAGKIPFICSFACFVVGRFEQIRMAVAYNRANVKIVGTHAGIGIGEDGYSQMATEDMGLMRTLPNMAVVQPADSIETRGAVEYIAQHDGPVFLRLTRQKVADVNGEGYVFRFGKAVVLREGADVSLVGTGAVMENVLKAAELLGRTRHQRPGRQHPHHQAHRHRVHRIRGFKPRQDRDRRGPRHLGRPRQRRSRSRGRTRPRPRPARRRHRVRRIRRHRGTLREVRTLRRAYRRGGGGVDGLGREIPPC